METCNRHGAVRVRRAAMGWVLCLVVVSVTVAADPARAGDDPSRGADVYVRACAHCHGLDGRGVDHVSLALPVPLPDFTDCRFAPREPDSDWLAVIHDGGPARAFHQTMPAFGEALSDDEARAVLAYVRGLCTSRAWPRGELNLPKALVTEKAFPEDEVIWLTTIDLEGPGGLGHKVVYEKRFGPRNQVEAVFPLLARGGTPTGWQGGIGDIALGFKRALWHSHERGGIFSATGEVKLPTGARDRGFGKGVAVFEPFITFGQVLPADGFVQFQGGLELPLERGHEQDAFWRIVLGRTFTQGRFGRSWSPMLEILAARELSSTGTTSWDLLPELQVSLSTRQHILFNVGVRLPVTDAGPRRAQLLTYLLWDWFDGGLFEGW